MHGYRDEDYLSASEREGLRPVTEAYHSAYCELREVL